MFDPTAPRSPFQDQAAEAGRTEAYWEWLDASRPTPPAAQAVHEDASGAGIWCRLRDVADADHEARHMRHSIGHSWHKYSALGEIFSLRSRSGVPHATVLVSSGVAVHARELGNARLSAANAAALERFAASAGFAIRPDDLPFDVFWDDASPNLRFRYLSRGPDNAKAFGDVVMEGRLERAEIDAMARTVGPAGTFEPTAVGLPDLDGAPGVVHEVQAISFVTTPAGPGSASDLAAAWAAAAEGGWSGAAAGREPRQGK